MGRRGPKPKAKPGAGPSVKAGRPPMPARLSADAKAAWKRIVPALHDRRMLTAADAEYLAALCGEYAAWQAAERVVNKEGAVLQAGTNGAKYLHPMVAVATKARAAWRAGLSELGLSPGSRPTVAPVAAGDGPSLEELMK